MLAELDFVVTIYCCHVLLCLWRGGTLCLVFPNHFVPVPRRRPRVELGYLLVVTILSSRLARTSPLPAPRRLVVRSGSRSFSRCLFA